MIKKILICFLLFLLTFNKCAFKVDDKGWPIKLKEGENQPHLIQGLTQCLQYNGQMGCCDLNNDKQQVGSYILIDGLFGYQGGGCDHCGINLKRFWCQYACSPRQSQFVKVEDGYFPIPDPQKPGKNITVQKVKLTVQAQTACDLYNSCKRIGYVTLVSAMGSPAGFLTFQGHNGVDQGLQQISIDFSYEKNNSLIFSDQEPQQRNKALSPCNTNVTSNSWHQFKFNQNCKCNTCQQACDNKSGFIYSQTSVMEGFNWILVVEIYVIFGVVAILATFLKNKMKKRNHVIQQKFIQ